MPPTTRHQAAEAAFRRLIDEGELAEPDEVQYTDDSVVFLWYESKLCVVIDLDDPDQPQDTPSGSASISSSSPVTSGATAPS